MPFIALKRDLFFALCALLVVVLYVGGTGGGFPLDDSWIHQTYARNLATYGEWAFVPGQPSAASTSPLYTVLLAIGYRMDLSPQLWTHAIGIFSLTMLGVLSAKLTHIIVPRSNYLPLVTGLAQITCWHLIWSASSGMETIVFSALTLWLIYLTWHEIISEHTTYKTFQRGIILGTSTAIITLARPEGIILGAISACLLLAIRPKGWRPLITLGVSGVVSFLLTLMPYLILNWQLTGGVLPNTANAKFAQHLPLLMIPYHLRFGDMLLAILIGGQFLLMPTLVYYILRQVRKRNGIVYLMPIFWAIALIALYAARLPASYQHGRYVIPALPALLCCGVWGMAYALDLGKHKMFNRILTRTLALATSGTFIVFAFVLGADTYRLDTAIINQEMVASAHWIRDNLPTDERLAIHDIGAVGYFAPETDLLDIAGLINPEIIPAIGNSEALWRIIQDNGAGYLMAFPDQIPNRNLSDERLCPIFSTGGEVAPMRGGANMVIYRLAWDGDCAD